MPKISVVMPVYNGEQYLRETIDSVLSQTYTDFEFIIVNDCSTDSTEEIIKSYNDDRIVYLKNDVNSRISKTLNNGIAVAKGEYIARIDADDICLPKRFEKQVKYLDKHKDVGVCGSNVTLFGAVNEYNTEFPINHDDICIQLLLCSQLAHPSVMMRKSVLEEYGHDIYNEHFNGREDYELWTRLAQKTKLHNIKTPLVKYRIHPKQITQNKGADHIDKEVELKKVILTRFGVSLSDEQIYTFQKYYCDNLEITLDQKNIMNGIFDIFLASNKFNKRRMKKYIKVMQKKLNAREIKE